MKISHLTATRSRSTELKSQKRDKELTRPMQSFDTWKQTVKFNNQIRQNYKLASRNGKILKPCRIWKNNSPDKVKIDFLKNQTRGFDSRLDCLLVKSVFIYEVVGRIHSEIQILSFQKQCLNYVYRETCACTYEWYYDNRHWKLVNRI